MRVKEHPRPCPRPTDNPNRLGQIRRPQERCLLDGTAGIHEGKKHIEHRFQLQAEFAQWTCKQSTLQTKQMMEGWGGNYWFQRNQRHAMMKKAIGVLCGLALPSISLYVHTSCPIEIQWNLNRSTEQRERWSLKAMGCVLCAALHTCPWERL